MITFFSIPKPFEGSIEHIQRNAIQSWLSTHPGCEVILFGCESGTAEVAQEFGIVHIPDIPTNAFNTPLLNAAFDLAATKARNTILVYVNADIIFLSHEAREGNVEDALRKIQYLPFVKSKITRLRMEHLL